MSVWNPSLETNSNAISVYLISSTHGSHSHVLSDLSTPVVSKKGRQIYNKDN